MRTTRLSQADLQLLRSMAVAAVLLSGTVALGIVLDSPLPLLALPAVALTLAYVYLGFGGDGAAIPSVSPPSADIDDDAGLPSPLLTDHFVAKEFAAARRGRDVTLVMFGFSRFDEFSEREGSIAAADALREFGRILQQMTRQMNLSARYGWRADAFLSVLSDANAIAAEGFIARVRSAVAMLNVPVPEIEVGVAVYQPHLASPEEFVQCAEQALAAARASSNVPVNR